MDFSFDNLNYNSVENVPGIEARAAFTVNSATVFKEDVDIVPTIVDETLSYIPWGGDNQLPYNVIDLIEKDETLATCQVFNAEVCFGSGLRYDTCLASQTVSDGATGSKWDRYPELHPQIYNLEVSLAEEWFSPEKISQLSGSVTIET